MDKALFKCYMTKNGDSIQTLAEALNIHPVTLYSKVKGEQPFKSPEMSIIVKRWDLTSDEVMAVFFNSKSA